MKTIQNAFRPGATWLTNRIVWLISFPLLITYLSTPVLAAGPTTARTIVMESPFHAPAKAGSASVPFQLDMGLYETLKEASAVTFTAFPVGQGHAVDLQLQRFSVFDEHTVFVIGTDNGDVPASPPDVILFRGRISEKSDSYAFVGLSPNGSIAVIRDRDSTFVIESDWDPASRRSGGSMTLATPGEGWDVDIGEALCEVVHVTDTVRSATAEKHPLSTSPLTGEKIASVAIDLDFGLYTLLGSNELASEMYMVLLLGSVAAVYHDEIGLNLHLGFSRVWTVADPLGNSIGDFRDWWNGNMGSGWRNHVHKLTDNLPGAAGIAYINCGSSLLCDENWSYAITQGNATLSLGEQLTFAQELGHNIGSDHTHCYDPPIDECSTDDNGACQACFAGTTVAQTGTIMSYCGTKNLTLHSRVRTFMIGRIQGNGCMPTAMSPVYVERDNKWDNDQDGTQAHAYWNIQQGIFSVDRGGDVFIYGYNPGPFVWKHDGGYDVLDNGLIITWPCKLKKWSSSLGDVIIGQWFEGANPSEPPQSTLDPNALSAPSSEEDNR